MKTTQNKKPRKSVKKPEKSRNKQENRDEKGRFIKGVSGNPAGKPAGLETGFSITRLVKEKLQELPEGADKDSKETYASLFIKRILAKAIKDGDVQMQKTIWAYMDGLPKEKVDITSQGEKITAINYIIPKDNGNNDNSDTETTPSVSDTG